MPAVPGPYLTRISRRLSSGLRPLPAAAVGGPVGLVAESGQNVSCFQATMRV